MTSLPDWLVERAMLEEVPAQSRDRLAQADRMELDARIAQLREDNAAELAAYPAAPAVALIEQRVKAARQRRRRVQLATLGSAVVAAAAIVIVTWPTVAAHRSVPDVEVTRVKGAAHLTAYRQVGDHAELLDEDTLVREGDTIQLRYSASGQLYGMIASVDGAGVVTLHYPASMDAPALATALAPKPTSLSQSYVLDDAPRFERFFFITSADPIEVRPALAALHALAGRADSESAAAELPAGLHQWSLRLRKPDQKGQTP